MTTEPEGKSPNVVTKSFARKEQEIFCVAQPHAQKPMFVSSHLQMLIIVMKQKKSFLVTGLRLPKSYSCRQLPV